MASNLSKNLWPNYRPASLYINKSSFTLIGHFVLLLYVQNCTSQTSVKAYSFKGKEYH
jgi:hypothetical protein